MSFNRGDAYTASRNLIMLVKKSFLKVSRIRIKAYSKLDRGWVTQDMGVELSRMSIDVVDVALGPGCADRMLMQDMFEFAMDYPPPGVVCLVSGDA